MDTRKRKRASGSPQTQRDDEIESEETQRDDEIESEETGQPHFADLPSTLLMEIFLKIPIMSLGKCRCVCKTWFYIISNPEFAKLHLSTSPLCILVKNKPPKRESKRLLLSKIPVPPQFKSGYKISLAVYDGCLSAWCYLADGSWEFDVCLMKEYGVKESWITLFRIKHVRLSVYMNFVNTFCFPLIYMKNGEILFSFMNDVVVCYNGEKGLLRDAKMFRTLGKFNAVGYTPSFVSLKEYVAKGEHITRKRSSRKHAEFLVEG
ncbi:hypothetical protein CCACVL1_22095 [Corchorus capsularis]|uniref:F-box domain-containing protein n=1 Tax=Corchorus capsularis TaxID=210143 RepID=A0A1R3H105_COCAP|nr:hypothetical protein CCACVL1_22095 [Corchorus capsularis]